MKKIYKIFSIFAFSCSRKDGSNNSMIPEGNGIENNLIAEKNFNKCRLNFCFGENKDYPNKKGEKYYENYGSETNFSICLTPYHKDLNQLQLNKISFGFTYPEYYDNFLKFKEIKIILEVSSGKKKVSKVTIYYYNDCYNFGCRERSLTFDGDYMFFKGIADVIIQINNILRKNRCYLFDISIHNSYEIKLQNESQCTIYTIKPNGNTKNSNYMQNGLCREKIIDIINDIYNYQIINESSKKNYSNSKIKLEKENSNLNLNNCTITYKYESPTNVHIGSENKMEEEPIQENSSKNKMEEEPIQKNSSENKMEEEHIQENSSENKMKNEHFELPESAFKRVPVDSNRNLNQESFESSESAFKRVKGPNKKKSESLGSVSEEDDEFRIC